MAIRTFKKFTITSGGTPQPLCGTTTTQIVNANAEHYANYSTPPKSFTITVADSSMFNPKDYALIGKPSTGQERLLVISVPTSTSINVQGSLANTYLSGVYIRPSFQINSTYVQTTQGNAAPIYIGNQDNLVKSTQAFVVSLLYQVSSGQPTEFRDGRSGLANADDCAQWWVDGTTNDGYLPSFGVV